MSLLFSDYLIEKKFVSQDQILEASLEQMKSIPTLVDVIYENEYLTKKDLLKVLSHQQSYGSDFCTSAEKLGVWSNEIKEKVYTRINSLRKPLGEILIEKNLIDIEILSLAFVSYVEETKLDTPKVIDETNTNQFNSLLLKNLLTLLDEKSLPYIEKNVNLLEQMMNPTIIETPEIMHTKFQELVKNCLCEFVGVRAELRTLGAKQTEGLVDASIKFLEIFSITNLPIEIPSVVQIIKSSLQILKSITPYLKDFKNENTSVS